MCYYGVSSSGARSEAVGGRHCRGKQGWKEDLKVISHLRQPNLD